MIQLTRALTTVNQSVYLDIYDKMTNSDYRPLFTFTSQASNTSFTFVPFIADYTNKNRYVKCSIFVSTAGFIPGSGIIHFGSTDLPYGFYDVVVYQNTSNSNLDPTGLTQIWEGLANVVAQNNPAVEYTEYNTNDSDTESVYITF
tara:strand:- start:1388 stop:1822 length:435 start_codon:yes stop_codon:yes gene_type:complete